MNKVAYANPAIPGLDASRWKTSVAQIHAKMEPTVRLLMANFRASVRLDFLGIVVNKGYEKMLFEFSNFQHSILARCRLCGKTV
jgi:hypothetical protein